MHTISKGERQHLNLEPVSGVRHWDDIDFVGDHIRWHRLDVIAPAGGRTAEGRLPVYIYFHGGGWTSGDKASLTKYCASQAAFGLVVVNLNYRMAPHFHLGHVLEDANEALAWVGLHIREFGGDAQRIVLGGDSAGGQISALTAAATFRPELAEHYALIPALPATSLRGLVQHCSIVDFSVFFDKGFVLSLNFIRMLLPHGGQRRAGGMAKHRLREESRYMSPIEWLDSRCPPVFITTSERDFFYSSNINFIHRLDQHGVPVDSMVYGWKNTNTEHTWQQNFRYPESQEVYGRLQSFISKVTA
ncbi:alpha/beta hydrolase [Arthrobacter wenxiniae]|jgi:acetyl esterase/lipase|uniref:Alpha/beta hydrolase n=1 Tax=Arthrobacter wenxiniae TaxID=2713570 RepID=A0A7Y7IES3_9MICC|nr:alpha/beta hydrolase [Arthrobacter wenxiniae]NVM94154.1 alpha/beta hydrolase [Arthrobacter wenxiniae]